MRKSGKDWRPRFIALLALVAACAAPQTSTSTSVATTAATDETQGTVTTAADELSAELINPGRVVICMTFPVARVSFYDATGEPAGQSVEFALELARRLSLEPEIRDTIFEQIIDAIEAGDCDFSLAGHFITPERLERIEMIPYLKGRQQMVVQIGNPEFIDDSVDICGRPVSSRAGTIQEDLILGVGLYEGSGLNDTCVEADLAPIDLVTFPGEAEAIDALRQGEVVAFLGGTTWVAEFPDELAIAPNVELPEFTNGIGVSKEHPLLTDALTSALDAMIADGTYLSIQDEWGVGQPITP